jgi:hypothetical protein
MPTQRMICLNTSSPSSGRLERAAYPHSPDAGHLSLRFGTVWSNVVGSPHTGHRAPQTSAAARGNTAGEEAVAALGTRFWETLANTPAEILREGHLFPWRTRFGVYKWPRPMVRGHGVKFTPHMARHSLAKWFQDEGASVKTTTEGLHQKGPKSAMRYKDGDVGETEDRQLV